MSGYFAQLLRQTGVKQRAIASPVAAIAVPPSTTSAVTPIDIHEGASIEPAHSQRHTNITGESGIHDPSQGLLQQQKTRFSKIVHSDMLVETDASLMKTDTISEPGNQDQAIQSTESTPSAFTASNEPVKSDDTLNSTGTLRQVQEWVAAPQAEETGIPKDQGHYQPTGTNSLSAVRNDQQGSTTTPQQQLDVEHQDFHLSIGAISLTIEEPSNPVQAPERQQVSLRKERPADASRSRLSRHYLRVR